MPGFLNRYATPFTLGFFLISLITGIALFFHFGPAGFRGMHEWLSLVLVLPFALHLWKNWRPMLVYFRGAPMLVALLLSAAAAVPFLLPSASGERTDGPPQFRLAHQVMSHPVAEVAPLFGGTTDVLTGALTAAGFTVADPSQPLSAVAAASGKSEIDLALALLSAGAQPAP